MNHAHHQVEELANIGRWTRGGPGGKRCAFDAMSAIEMASEALDRLSRGVRIPLSTADMAEKRLDRMRAGKEKCALKRARDQAVVAKDLFQNAWHHGVAERQSNQAPGWARQKGVDGRTQMIQSIQGDGFQAASLSGSAI